MTLDSRCVYSLSVVVAAGQKCAVATASATATSPTSVVESTPAMVFHN